MTRAIFGHSGYLPRGTRRCPMEGCAWPSGHTGGHDSRRRWPRWLREQLNAPRGGGGIKTAWRQITHAPRPSDWLRVWSAGETAGRTMRLHPGPSWAPMLAHP